MTKIVNQVIEDEMKQAYVDYAMSVIVGRALPNVRDGLKPVHRRILYSMYKNGLLSNKSFRKSAHIVGDVLGNYHPHGDQSVYDALVRMAQDFSLRYPLVNGQGNWGSIDGDNAAAYRYCVTGDTLIQTKKGLMPISSISSAKESKINLKILSFNGKKNTAVKFFNSGRHKTRKIVTNFGYEIEGSLNHPVLTWSHTSTFRPKIMWKTLQQVQEGDIVIINREHSLFPVNALNLQNYHPKSTYNSKATLPKKMSKSLSFLLGALVSKGTCHEKKLLFQTKDKQLLKKIISILLKEFKGIQLPRRQTLISRSQFVIGEQKVIRFLENIGLNLKAPVYNQVPFSVLQSTREHQKMFLSALFDSSSDATSVFAKKVNAKSANLDYSSRSASLLSQLKVMLLSFGITSSHVISNKNASQKLVISSAHNLTRFVKSIGFFNKKKSDTLVRLAKLNSSSLSRTDLIPYLSDYVKTNYTNSSKYNVESYSGLKKSFSKLKEILLPQDKKMVQWLMRNRYFFDPIKTITNKKSKSTVYSVKVNSKCHSFIANGFINHNTEAKLQKISESLLSDIDKETVEFRPNFDESTKEPLILPSKVPNLLVNGSTGIAVGMATNIPTHNLSEVCRATIHLIDEPEAEVEDLIKIMPGPDFPTGAKIAGKMGILEAYKTGHGRVIIKSVAKVSDDKIVVTEIPYMVNKAQMIEEMADLVRAKKVDGIRNIRDESDKDGVRVVIEIKHGSDSNVVLNQLYKYSRLKTSFRMNFLALVDNVPRVLNLKKILSLFIEHRNDIVRKRTEYELRKAKERLHILEGLILALNNINDVISGIRKSSNAKSAQDFLMKTYSLTELQAKAILEMRLQKLAALEQESVREEHNDLKSKVIEYEEILGSQQKINSIIKAELNDIINSFGDARRTQITDEEEGSYQNIEDLIEEKDVVVTITHAGYVKRIDLETYKQQRRGGRGVTAAATREEDFVKGLFVSSTHNYILVFTSKGQVHWLKVYELPEASRHSKGRPIVNMLNLANDEKVSAFIPLKDFTKGSYIFMSTLKGIVKKTSVESFSRPRKGGIRALSIDDSDELIGVRLTNGNNEIILATRNGHAVRFNESDVRPMGRTATGVRGIRLGENDYVIGMARANESRTLLTVTDKGYGKRTRVSDYRLISRGGKGVINMTLTGKNGKVAGIKSLDEDDEIMLISRKGVAIRTFAKYISIIGRATQGVRVMRLDKDDELVAVEKIINGKD